ncbi:hypothetical protein JYT28_01325, partial [Desulfobulbus sp. AH-315-M07]|nr:hypothetical protein [Desulfobulbus sp. AH-315-M07]
MRNTLLFAPTLLATLAFSGNANAATITDEFGDLIHLVNKNDTSCKITPIHATLLWDGTVMFIGLKQ